MTSPTELALQFVFDDGPGKTVYSYERMNFDFAGAEVKWISGTAMRTEYVHEIRSNIVTDGIRRIVFEKAAADGRERYTLELSQKTLILTKEAVDAGAHVKFRNRFSFRRPAG